MSDADEAFEAARRLIAEAKAEGGTKLSLDFFETHALTRLPPEIAELSDLDHLDLDNTGVTDLSPLSCLSGLKTLYLNDTGVTDLSPLSGLSGLTTLFLNGTGVSDLSPLSGLPGLEALSLSGTGVSDLSPLSGLTGLTSLWLNGTDVTDLSPLSGLSGLTRLYLDDTGVTDLSPLSGLTDLMTLLLNGTGVTDLSPLSGLSGLTSLWLDKTSAVDLSPLSGLEGLTTLWLIHTDVVDLSPLSGLMGLTELGLDGTDVVDLSPLTGLSRLTELWMNDTGVTDLSPLSGLSGLTGLWLSGTGVTDLSPLADLTELTELRLNRSQVADLSPLSALPNLTTLWLNGTGVTDLSPLSDLTHLVELGVSETGVADIMPLSGLRMLRRLEIDQTPILDLRPIRGLEFLTVAPERPRAWGLTFKNSAAARADPRIAEIAEIKDPAERARTLFDYLKDWVPPPEPEDVPEQTDRGLRYRVSEDRTLEYDPRPSSVQVDDALAQFHGLLLEEAGTLASRCSGGPNLMYQPLAEQVNRYRTALGNGPDAFMPAFLWKTGNDLRLALRSDDHRGLDDLEGMPKLGPDQRVSLESLVSTHNVFSDLHPELARLDSAQIDPAERHRAMANTQAMEAALDALAGQLDLIRAEIVKDLRDLHAEAQGEAETALRAMRIERESMENLIKAIVVQGVVEAKDDKLLSKVGGDLRAWAVGGAAGLLGPEVAANYPQLVAALQPHISVLLSSWHGKDYPVAKVVDWIVARARAAERDPDA